MELVKLGRSAGTAIVVGLGIVVLGMLIVRNGTVSDVEESVFRAVNDLPGWLYAVAGPLQLLGALVLGPIVAVVALVLRRYRLAIAALLVTLLKLLSERGVKAMVSRQRPGTSIGPDIEMPRRRAPHRRELRVRSRRAGGGDRHRRQPVCAGSLEDRAVGRRGGRLRRARLRRCAQPARRRVRRWAGRRHRCRRQRGDGLAPAPAAGRRRRGAGTGAARRRGPTAPAAVTGRGPDTLRSRGHRRHPRPAHPRRVRP